MKDGYFMLFCTIIAAYAGWGALMAYGMFGWQPVIISLLLCVLLSWLSYVGNPFAKGASDVREKTKG